jgi:hypothetical protein
LVTSGHGVRVSLRGRGHYHAAAQLVARPGPAATSTSAAEASSADQVVLLAGRAVAWGPAAEVLFPARLAAAYGPEAVDPPPP